MKFTAPDGLNFAGWNTAADGSGTAYKAGASQIYDQTGDLTLYAQWEAKSFSVDLNNDQWVDSGTTVDGNTVYKSDSGSYHVANGKSVATITVTGYTTFTVYIRSYAESTWDYTEAFEADVTAVRDRSNPKSKYSTKGNQSNTTYTACTYNLDGGTHTIQILYSKDGSGDSNDDRGYFYIPANQ